MMNVDEYVFSVFDAMFIGRGWNQTFRSIVLYMVAPRARTWSSQWDATPNGFSIRWSPPPSSQSATSRPLP
uniref:Uncharacterized protein n=1 Tax=Arundo donax TaxID=35708 RepID=A0A0A8ZJ40_ARUDO